MKQSSTMFLKLTLFIMGVIVLALSVWGLLAIAHEPGEVNPDYVHVLYPILIGLYATTVPFFFALYQAFKLLRYIDESKAFSDLSVGALKNIKYCGIAISVLYGALMPFLYILAEKDDAPGVIVIGLLMIGASLVFAVFAAVLQKLVRNAIDIQLENELTV